MKTFVLIFGLLAIYQIQISSCMQRPTFPPPIYMQSPYSRSLISNLAMDGFKMGRKVVGKVGNLFSDTGADLPEICFGLPMLEVCGKIHDVRVKIMDSANGCFKGYVKVLGAEAVALDVCAKVSAGGSDESSEEEEAT